MLSVKYRMEQQQLDETIKTVSARLEDAKAETDDAKRWVDLIRKYRTQHANKKIDTPHNDIPHYLVHTAPSAEVCFLWQHFNFMSSTYAGGRFRQTLTIF